MTKPMLSGFTVLDLSRMLPGAIAARFLIERGMRVIKVESPDGGDPLRYSPPFVDGISAAFAAFYGGAQSLISDLRTPHGARMIRRLVRHVDVVIESFRPGRLDGWGLAPSRLFQINPSLVLCSISSFGQTGPEAHHVGHDLNFVAESGFLRMCGSRAVPLLQVADVTAGLAAGSDIVTALLARTRTGSGTHLDISLHGALNPFFWLSRAEHEAGGGGLANAVLAGRCAAYNLYACSDGEFIAVAALEPKFWGAFSELLGVPGLAGAGLETGEAGEAAIAATQSVLLTKPAPEWVRLARELQLPISPVNHLHGPDGHRAAERGLSRKAPTLGEHSACILKSFGLD